MPHENVTIEQVAELLGVELTPPLDGADVQALHKALPGYQAMVDDTSRLLGAGACRNPPPCACGHG